MDAHFQTYLRARSLSPFIPKSIVDEVLANQSRGYFLIPTAELYQDYGYSCHLVFNTAQFDTEEKYKQYQDIGHWINQSFFIEVKCILDTFMNWKDSPLVDEKHFELLGKCRHLFAHNSYKLDYKPRKGHEEDFKHASVLYNELFGHIVETNTELNLSIINR